MAGVLPDQTLSHSYSEGRRITPFFRGLQKRRLRQFAVRELPQAVRRSPNTRNVPKENASVIPFLQWPASDGAAFEWGALHASRRGPWISLGTPPARPRVHFLNQGTSPSPDRLNDDRQRCLRLICLIKHRRRDSRLGAPCSRPPRYLVSLSLTTFRTSRLLPVFEDGTTGQGREGGEEE